MTNNDRNGDNPDPPSGQEPGAEIWVDQWISLFGDDPADGSGPAPQVPGDDEPVDQFDELDQFEPVGSAETTVDAGPQPTDLDPDPVGPSEDLSAEADESDESDDEAPLDEDEPPLDDDVATIEAWQRAQERSRRQAKVRATPNCRGR